MPLGQLTQKNSAWHWESEHAHSVDSLKRAITSAPVLALYKSKEPVSLATDASNHGCGVVLMQEKDHPIAYGMRRVNDA